MRKCQTLLLREIEKFGVCCCCWRGEEKEEGVCFRFLIDRSDWECLVACNKSGLAKSGNVTHSLMVRWRLEVKLGGESQESERDHGREERNGGSSF